MDSPARPILVVFGAVAVLLWLLFSSACTSDDPPVPPPPPTPSPTTQGPIIDNTFDPTGKPLIFKGIYLGMTFDELKKKALKKEVPWKYEKFNGPTDLYEPRDRRGDDFAFFLNEKDRWIGYEGEGKEKRYYKIYETREKWFEQRIVSISIVSPVFHADQINTNFKEWMRFAISELEKKYGKPTEIKVPVDSLSIFHFKSREAMICYRWERLRERIDVYVTEQHFQYHCIINFENIEGVMNKYNADKRNPKSAF